MSIRILSVLTLILGVGACGPSGEPSADESTQTSGDADDSETGDIDPNDGETGDDETGDGDPDPPIPRECGELECGWTASEQTIEWATLPPPPLPPMSNTHAPCGHGYEPKFVVDGDTIVIAYRDQYCTDEVGGEGEPLAPTHRLIIGSDTAGTWETAIVAVWEYGARSIDLAGDGTVFVGGGERVYRRTNDAWQVLDPGTGGRPWILPDPEAGPDHLLFWGPGADEYRRIVDGVSEPDHGFACETGTWRSQPDFVLSPAGIPHILEFTSKLVPSDWSPVAVELTLSLSSPRDGEWALEQIECLVGGLTGNKTPAKPDLEFDQGGNAHICIVHKKPDELEYVTSYYTNVGGTWSSEEVGEGSGLYPCELELDDVGRVHLLLARDYVVREDGVWSTAWSFADQSYGSLKVTGDGSVYIVRDGLGLLSNASGEWVERQLGVGYVP